MKFDLEAARQGKPIEYRVYGDEWAAVHFVGLANCGNIVIEHGPKLIAVFESSLRMKPEPKVLYFVPYLDSNGTPKYSALYPEQPPNPEQVCHPNPKWIGEPIRIEYPEESKG